MLNYIYSTQRRLSRFAHADDLADRFNEAEYDNDNNSDNVNVNIMMIVII